MAGISILGEFEFAKLEFEFWRINVNLICVVGCLPDSSAHSLPHHVYLSFDETLRSFE
jgi:hypothetical protein